MHSILCECISLIKIELQTETITHKHTRKKELQEIIYTKIHFAAAASNNLLLMSWENFSIIHLVNLLSHYIKPIGFCVFVASMKHKHTQKRSKESMVSNHGFNCIEVRKINCNPFKQIHTSIDHFNMMIS